MNSFKSNRPYQVEGNTITLRIQVQPRSSSIQWGKLVDQQWIQLRITAPPVDGAANKMCIKTIARRFKTSKSKVCIKNGEKSRYKTIVAEDCDPVQLKLFRENYPVT